MTPAADTGQKLWLACIEQLATELPEQQFNTWIKPLKATASDDLSKIVLLIANRFKLDWIRAQYAARISRILEKIHGHPVTLELTLAPREAPIRFDPVTQTSSSSPVHHLNNNSNNLPTKEKSKSASDLTPNQHHQLGNVGNFGNAVASGNTAHLLKNRLNTGLTFDTLVEGPANRIARTAAMHVSELPGHLYNPLFIYGGVGLGKTHLMHAVGNKLLLDRPQSKVLHIHAEQFVTDVVKAYQRKAFDEFKHRYHSLDLLLIDDIQFFANKDRTQEEFFNAFEALLAKQSHIVMTSDIYPQGLSDIHERLVSRFNSGLTVSLDPPELDMRVAILVNKARSECATLPEDVALFIAKNVSANIRELEGALRKVLAYSRFNQKPISTPLAREALRDLLKLQTQQHQQHLINIEGIQNVVADFYKINIADLQSKKRTANIARARHVAMYLIKELTAKSLLEIGNLFGGRDHTTVMHAVRKITGERQKMPDLNQQIQIIEQTLKGEI